MEESSTFRFVSTDYSIQPEGRGGTDSRHIGCRRRECRLWVVQVNDVCVYI